MVESKIKSIKKIKTTNVVYDITTKSHTLICNNIYTHNCSGHNPEYIKRYGIRGMKNIPTASAPAGTAWTAVRHIASATMFFTSLFAGAM